MIPPSSAQIAAQIEDLYGAPLVDLEAHVRDQPSGMLAALLGGHHTLALAERSITVHCERIRQLVVPEQQMGTEVVPHILDCSRRLTEAVAVRDTQSATIQAVLQSLGRTPAPEQPAAPTSVPSVPASTTSAGTAPGR
ncbi:hypothetical protein ACIQ7D_10275 [Streptomyces sp. NPDC096310]|uniref:hypothetical protein n=1 Tax=Streptomyces sp. NPDC096310 TaxID=3366082 RepID=UPI00380F1CF5